MILIVVYVGAVAVLFLFVVMMLDVDFAELREGFLQYLPVGALVGLVFLVELILVVGSWVSGPGIAAAIKSPIPALAQTTNTEAIGRVLYTTYVHYFQLAGVSALGRDDRRDRADPASSSEREAPECFGAKCAHARDRDRCRQGQVR